MNDSLLLLMQMIQNGDLGGSSGGAPVNVIMEVDGLGQIQKALQYMAGNTNYSGFITNRSDPTNNFFAFDAGSNSDYVFEKNSNLLAAFDNILMELTSINDPTALGPVFNTKIIVLDRVGITTFDSFVPAANSGAFSCNIHFDTHFPFSGSENTAYGKFEGRMHYVKTVVPSEGPGDSTATTIALDAGYGICNLQIVPSNPS